MAHRGYIAGLTLLCVLLGAGAVQSKPERLIGKPAPTFTLSQLDGKRISLSNLKGKVVLLNFWDFGCPSCNQEIRHLERFHRAYHGKGLRVIGVAELAPEAKQVKKFLQEYQASYPVMLDPEQVVSRKYGVVAHPATVILDRQGVVRFVHTGFLNGDEVTLENSIKALLEGRKIARR